MFKQPARTSLMMSALLILGVLTIQPANAHPCLDQNEWFCHPDPDVSPEVGPCAMDCRTETYRLVGPGDEIGTPSVWLVWCQTDAPIRALVPVLSASEMACPAGWEPTDTALTQELVPATDVAATDGPAILTITSGQCAVSMKAQVYGMGFTGQDEYVPCAYPA